MIEAKDKIFINLHLTRHEMPCVDEALLTTQPGVHPGTRSSHPGVHSLHCMAKAPLGAACNALRLQCKQRVKIVDTKQLLVHTNSFLSTYPLGAGPPG
jgi:hypothetical protein